MSGAADIDSPRGVEISVQRGRCRAVIDSGDSGSERGKFRFAETEALLGELAGKDLNAGGKTVRCASAEDFGEQRFHPGRRVFVKARTDEQNELRARILDQ